MNGEQTNFRRDVAMLVRLLRDHEVLTELSCDEHACIGGIHDNECGFACTPYGCPGHEVNCDCWLHDAHRLLDRLERSLEMGPSYDPADCNGRSGSADDCPGCSWCQDSLLDALVTNAKSAVQIRKMGFLG